METSLALFSLVLCISLGSMLKHFSNFLSYLILIESTCVGLGAVLIYSQGLASSFSLFIFLVLVACETSLGYSVMVGIMRNSESGVYSLYSVSA
uniref:NADH dehydrogenase subunit 4L n=1 Tax=Crassostrea tulipa TaxID=2912563 RepID=A0A0K0PXP3_9BIVA|nr:NADH dehydrogenase subunit 4L [Crassostrea gasar]AKQ78441.1 NADH dehydrogenase subunit 4L [Crassostrea gasar]